MDDGAQSRGFVVEKPAGAVPAVALQGITKAFPGVVANDSIDLRLWAGEIHCLLGENGAGKSTLMNILSGMYQADSGAVSVAGRHVDIDSPAKAIELGIGTVYQHPTLVSTFTVMENLLLGARGPARARFKLDRRGALVRYQDLAGRLGVTVAPDAVVADLDLGRQQQVEIVKALWAEPRILILDEPTSMLAPQEVDDLGRVLAALREQGLAVVLITHKLREALALGDRVTVLREGRVAGRVDPEAMRAAALAAAGAAAPMGAPAQVPAGIQAQIVQMMFGEAGGETIAELTDGEPASRERRELPAEVALAADAISVEAGRQETGLADVTFAVRRGEIFGVAGVDGNGQTELAEAVAGQRPLAAGRLTLAGADITRQTVAERQAAGLHYLTDDRMGEGIVPSLPISLNLLLKRIGQRPFWKAGRLSQAAVDENAARLIAGFDIRAAGAGTLAGTLSGGNIQKMILARELAFGATVMVYNKPTTGLDLKTTAAIRARIRALAGEGVAALLVSNDLDEVLELSDRIAVMYRGRLAGVVDNDGPGVRQRVGALMLGGAAPGAAGAGSNQAAAGPDVAAPGGATRGDRP